MPSMTPGLWRLVHNAIVHPLMEVLPEAWGDALHEATGRLAFPCRGFQVAPNRWSGCDAAKTGAKDCPACGPRLTCPGCGETVLEVESSARGWRGQTHDGGAGGWVVLCPECHAGQDPS